MLHLPDAFSLYDTIPDTLLNTCLNYMVANLKVVTNEDPTSVFTSALTLRSDVVLPTEICELLLEAYQKSHRITDSFANLFQDTDRTRLQVVKLHNALITDQGLQFFMKHKPKVLELVKCDSLSTQALKIIIYNSENLVSLRYGPMVCLREDGQGQIVKENLLQASELRHLTVHQCTNTISPLLFLKTLKNLTHLDLSECQTHHTVTSIWVLSELIHLQTLILYSVHWCKDITHWIILCRALRHLDVSQSVEIHGKYNNPNEVLTKIVTNLPNLEYLDISGTNLAGNGAAAIGDEVETAVRCDIPGLLPRVNRPLEFLGLYGTQHGACSRHDIPAKMISGDSNEEQVLTAAAAYIERPAMLTRVLNDLYYLFRYENSTTVANLGKALAVVLKAMDLHVTEKHIQISGSATLFYILKGKEKPPIGIKLRNRIISALLNGMDAHPRDDTMLRNGCLTLCQFKIPADVLFEYERVVKILIKGVSEINQEGFVQRIAIYLLNSLACQVDGKQKRFLGDVGTIETMLNLIRDRLDRRLCDDVLEVAWSTMWNVTDETPQNCESFLYNNGMDYFIACLKTFPDKEELLRNMMGLLGNVAEVASLRPKLMNKLFLTVFFELLLSCSDGIEVSYNAAGVLAHMASDGPEAWTVEDPPREAVLNRVSEAVGRWDLLAVRNINYRSFEPILGLLNAHHTPQCQHWAVWALANLTSVYPTKYCKLVKAEGGIELLTKLVNMPGTDENYDTIKQLANIVILNCAKYAAKPKNVENNMECYSPDN